MEDISYGHIHKEPWGINHRRHEEDTEVRAKISPDIESETESADLEVLLTDDDTDSDSPPFRVTGAFKPKRPSRRKLFAAHLLVGLLFLMTLVVSLWWGFDSGPNGTIRFRLALLASRSSTMEAPHLSERLVMSAVPLTLALMLLGLLYL
ncbi:MAG: hypothetical protein KVP17_004699 [Porospora cf. gigantea B]|uniref:uncharacterized protein n=1 Tax=Porospora cf. gigantea B TaxID=2853592 RepID=UPI003571BAB0|nr:MAG: hypothetical protein KVP17_004699 [Porospora cf. gigantea B]